MPLRMDRMRLKEVIDIDSGDRYGFVGDLELDSESGAIEAIVVLGRLRLWGLLGREEDIVIPWRCIQRIGEDTILVDGSQIRPGLGQRGEIRREKHKFF